MRLKRIPVISGLGFGLLASLVTGAGAAQRDPIALYGERVVFDIVRNGETIGHQTLAFKQENDELTVKVVTDMQVEMLFVTVYRYRYEAVMRWRDGRMREMVPTTDDDGKLSLVTARFDGRRRVLPNGVTGKLDPITVTDEGPDTVSTPAGKRAAHRYGVSGALQLTNWYDAEGRWVGLRFKARDGSTIDYVCGQCGPASKNWPAD